MPIKALNEMNSLIDVRALLPEVLVAGDNSCLAHIGGLLHRGRTGVKTIHLAEVLASTEQDPA